MVVASCLPQCHLSASPPRHESGVHGRCLRGRRGRKIQDQPAIFVAALVQYSRQFYEGITITQLMQTQTSPGSCFWRVIAEPEKMSFGHNDKSVLTGWPSFVTV
jgi:hypothetical protein